VFTTALDSLGLNISEGSHYPLGGQQLPLLQRSPNRHAHVEVIAQIFQVFETGSLDAQGLLVVDIFFGVFLQNLLLSVNLVQFLSGFGLWCFSKHYFQESGNGHPAPKYYIQMWTCSVRESSYS